MSIKYNLFGKNADGNDVVYACTFVQTFYLGLLSATETDAPLTIEEHNQNVALIRKSTTESQKADIVRRGVSLFTKTTTNEPKAEDTRYENGTFLTVKEVKGETRFLPYNQNKPIEIIVNRNTANGYTITLASNTLAAKERERDRPTSWDFTKEQFDKTFKVYKL